jgi:tRNA-Thr(GGU) m(6)t(6)A37 methyltransferase TsaA
VHYLLFYDVVDGYVERRKPLRDEHIAYARRAVERGELVLGGAFAGPVDGAVLLFRGDSPATAEAFARSDPYVTHGLVKSWRVREWTTVVGAGAEAALPSGALLRPIGTVRSPVTEPVDEGWGDVESKVVVEPAYRAGLRGLADFSHLLVVAYLHGAAFDPARHLVRRPRGLAELPELGIFAQRAKDRPNPLGVTAVRLVRVDDDGVVVHGLDAIDGTPVLDLKPYFPQFDAVACARVPAWVETLMRGYF